MDKKLEQSCIRLQAKINQVEVHLSHVTNHLKSVTETEIITLEHNIEKARQECDDKRDKVTDAVQRGVEQFIEDAKSKAYTKWITERESTKIEDMADKKEQQAIDAVMVAAFSCLEAEVVILDALKTRKAAIEVLG